LKRKKSSGRQPLLREAPEAISDVLLEGGTNFFLNWRGKKSGGGGIFLEKEPSGKGYPEGKNSPFGDNLTEKSTQGVTTFFVTGCAGNWGEGSKNVHKALEKKGLDYYGRNRGQRGGLPSEATKKTSLYKSAAWKGFGKLTHRLLRGGTN